MNIVLLIIGVILLILDIFIIILFLLKSHNNVEIVEKLGKFELSINQDLTLFKDNLENGLNNKFDNLNQKLEGRLNLISDNVNKRLDTNLEKSNQTFTNIIARLATIDNAQKKIENLSQDIVSLQSVLTDKKTRGIFGEVNLHHILSNVFGENNEKLYKEQYKLKNGYIADAILFAPLPLGTICIDSKFPLENYERMVDKNLSLEERKTYEKNFKTDFKKHIDAISMKYIEIEETSDQAIMFLPAEAIFAEVNAYHHDLLEYGAKRKVWITSPTTLISTLTIIEMIFKNIERDKYTSIIHEELNKLGNDFRLYRERWDKLSRSIETVSKDAEQVNITTEKISKKFDNISQVQIEEKFDK